MRPWRQKSPSTFQSTLPVRGATWSRPTAGPLTLNFNPRSPCGERRCRTCRRRLSQHFNPRSPCGERPRYSRRNAYCQHFNPRSPCGERPRSGKHWRWSYAFQSTLPVRGATEMQGNIGQLGKISIHAPRAGSDFHCPQWDAKTGNFNPRSPCGERPRVIYANAVTI